ncbi:MAG: hypothetical protein NVSMB66_2120 [Candidatus Doudnabacteria bacterium]
MDKRYLGISGPILSGKSSAANFLEEKFKADHLRFSELIDEILDVLDLPNSRINEQDLGVLLKELFGEEVLSNALTERAKSSLSPIVLFDGLRKKQELDFLKTLPGFKFIYIKSSPEKRYQRLLHRNEKINESKQSYEQFLETQNHDADKQMAELEQHADFIIVNESTPQYLEEQLTKILTIDLWS